MSQGENNKGLRFRGSYLACSSTQWIKHKPQRGFLRHVLWVYICLFNCLVQVLVIKDWSGKRPLFHLSMFRALIPSSLQRETFNINNIIIIYGISEHIHYKCGSSALKIKYKTILQS